MVKYVTTVSQEEVKRRTRKQELWLCFFVFVVLTISAVVGCSVLSKTSDPGGQKIRTPQLSKGIEINTSIEVNR